MMLTKMLRAAALAATLVFACAGGAQAEPCAEGQAATDYEVWEYIANNAKQTADAYATKRNPQAVFAIGKVTPYYQAGGEFKGQYLVQVLHEGRGGVSLAMLKPNFPFCSDPGQLNDEQPDLFTVISAKFNGRPF